MSGASRPVRLRAPRHQDRAAASAGAEDGSHTCRRPLRRSRAASHATRADRSCPPPSAPHRRGTCHALSPAVLPVRFGAYMTDDELPQIVRARRAVLLRALKHVRGRDQMTVRIFGPALEVLPASRPSSGSDYLRARAAAMRPALTPGARALVKAVSSVVDAQHVSGSRGGVQLTIDHLVRRSNVARYRRLLSSCVEELQPRLDVAVSGPWPPFAFAPDIWTPAAGGKNS